jgi:DNA-binding MarR family transcriptional regulator
MTRTARLAAAKPATDFGPLDGYIGYRLRRAQLYVFDEFAAALKPVDLKPAQFSALLLIAHNPGVSQGEIGDALGIQRTNFVGFAEALEQRGLIERRRAPHSRRSYALHLTAAGRALLNEALELHGDLERRLAAKLGPGGHDRVLALLARLTKS